MAWHVDKNTDTTLNLWQWSRVRIPSINLYLFAQMSSLVILTWPCLQSRGN
jgi:hypothetical protein